MRVEVEIVGVEKIINFDLRFQLILSLAMIDIVQLLYLKYYYLQAAGIFAMMS